LRAGWGRFGEEGIVTADFAGIASEIVLAGSLVVLLLLDLLLPKRPGRNRILTGAAVVCLMASFAALVLVRTTPLPLFFGMLSGDALAMFFKGLFLTAALLAVLFAALSDEIRRAQFGEYLLLLFCLTLGLCLLVAARNLLMLYLSLELVSLPSYVLAGFRRGDRRSSEAALKYVVFGAASSGLMLYGFSLLYGLSGTLEISGLGRDIVQRVAQGGIGDGLAVTVAVLFSLVGFGYKIAAVPFHMWCPDVYEGAPTPFVAFLSVGPKAAGMAALLRFFLTGFGVPPAFGVVGEFPWPVVLGVLSMATMTVGNLAALAQENIKRLLAYSSIAHAGYMLMAVAVGSPTATRAIMLYLPIYLFMNMGAFFAVMAVRQRTGSEFLTAYRGLGSRSPLLAVTLAIFLFSLTGLPPFAGFIGKFYLFAALLQTRAPFFYALAIVGVLNSVISLYYYVRIVRVMFLDKSEEAAWTPAGTSSAMLTVLAVPTLLLGIWWGPLAGVIDRAAGILK
jgi:NADH-quinone oxidoreductase subunit N